MKKLLLLVGLVVFLTPSLAKAELKLTYLVCEREMYFEIKEKSFFFFNFNRVKLYVENMVTTYLKKTNFNDEFIEGVFQAPFGHGLDKFKIFPNELIVEWERFDNNDNNLKFFYSLVCKRTYRLGWQPGMKKSWEFVKE